MLSNDTQPVGHLFIINGDLTKLDCDALLVPTDGRASVTAGFQPLVASVEAQALMNRLRRGGWGDATVRLVETAEPGPQVWLSNLGGTEKTRVSEFVVAAETFVEVATEHLRSLGSKQARLVFALPVVGSGRGGGAKRRGLILRRLVPRLMKLAAELDIDIVLVAYGQVSFDAAQAVRRDHIAREAAKGSSTANPWRHFDEATCAAADAIADDARAGNLVAFVGAGVSAGAGLPAWQELLNDVAKSLGLSKAAIAAMGELDVRDQAALLSRKKQFVAAVTAALAADRYSLTHGLLVSLPVTEFVTTNFDRLLETASETPGGKLSVVPGEPVRSSARILVKLHGTLGQDLVLTRTQYRDVKSRHGALFGLLQAMLVSKHMLFVGYSLRDEDFNDVMHDVRALHEATVLGRGVQRDFVGSVLSDFQNEQFGELWNDLRMIPALPSRHDAKGSVRSTTAEDWAAVTRHHALFLDLVGMKSASGVRFVTDRTFAGVGDRDARRLAAAVDQLRKVYEECGDNKSGPWHEIRALLERFSFEAS